MHFSPKCAVTALALCTFTPLSRALTINLSYDSSVTSLSNAAGYEAATNYAAQQLSQLFSDPINVNITVSATNDTSVLGTSNTTVLGTVQYATVRAALAADSTLGDASDAAAVASLGAADPTNGGNFYLASAQAKALKLIPNNSSSDGSFTFGTNPLGISTNNAYTLDPNNRAVQGRYDFIGIAEHEISRILGRIDGLGAEVSGASAFLPLDLFRYTAAGVRSLSRTQGGAYFSIDAGAIDLHGFNSNSSGDLSDWDNSVSDAFDTGSIAGVENNLSSEDVQLLDVLGYDPSGVINPINEIIPEPASFSLLTCGIFGLLAARRRQA
jgi:hypothetical protein